MLAGAIPFTLSVMAETIKALYQMGSSINEFMDRHIEEMKASDNPTVERLGRLLEAAKAGFGLGYVSSIIIIAAGQLLLGNPLNAVIVTVQTATFANPIAMTCGALGALLYGYSALSGKEREELLLKLTHGLDVGIELIKSVIKFVVEKATAFLGSEYATAVKEFIREKAALFGRKLGQITRKVPDIARDLAGELKVKTSTSLDSLSDTVKNALDQNSDGEVNLADVTHLYSEILKIWPRKTKPTELQLPNDPSSN